jgi:hypothetical protein
MSALLGYISQLLSCIQNYTLLILIIIFIIFITVAGYKLIGHYFKNH